MRYRELPHKSGIYLITNTVSGKVYVGSACDLSERRRRHFGNLRRGRHINIHLQGAWDQYGEDSFTFSVLIVCDRSSLIFFEQRAIDTFLSSRGKDQLYNKDYTAGSRLGSKMTEETRAKLKANNSRPMLGKKHTPETRARMSAAAKARCADPAWKERMRIINTGRVDSPETKAKRSAAALARAPFADVSREKVRAAKFKWWAEKKEAAQNEV